MPQSTRDIKLDETKLFLFVGPADAGKSYAATSFGLMSKEYGGTDDRPAYVLELDGRLAALRNRPVVYDSYTNIEGAIGVLNRVKAASRTNIYNLDKDKLVKIMDNLDITKLFLWFFQEFHIAVNV